MSSHEAVLTTVYIDGGGKTEISTSSMSVFSDERDAFVENMLAKHAEALQVLLGTTGTVIP